MVDPVREIKIRAELLHRKVARREAAALSRLRVLREYVALGERELHAHAETVRRKHCLSVVSVELGFRDYGHALRVIEGDPSERDLGKQPCERGSGLNLWFASYDEAHEQHRSRGGYLLAYRHHFVLVEAPYIDDLGLDPRDPDWERIGYDWARPRDLEARKRLYGKWFARQPKEHDPGPLPTLGPR